MKKEESKQIEELVDLIKEQYEQNKQLLVLARESINPGYSEQILKLKEEVSNIGLKIDEINKKHEERDRAMDEKFAPILSVYTDVPRLGRLIKWTFYTVTGVVITTYATVTASKGINNLFK